MPVHTVASYQSRCCNLTQPKPCSRRMEWWEGGNRSWLCLSSTISSNQTTFHSLSLLNTWGQFRAKQNKSRCETGICAQAKRCFSDALTSWHSENSVFKHHQHTMPASIRHTVPQQRASQNAIGLIATASGKAAPTSAGTAEPSAFTHVFSQPSSINQTNSQGTLHHPTSQNEKVQRQSAPRMAWLHDCQKIQCNSIIGGRVCPYTQLRPISPAVAT